MNIVFFCIFFNWWFGFSTMLSFMLWWGLLLYYSFSALHQQLINFSHKMCSEIFCMNLGPSLCYALFVYIFLSCDNKKTRGLYHKCIPFLSTWCQSLILWFVSSRWNHCLSVSILSRNCLILISGYSFHFSFFSCFFLSFPLLPPSSAFTLSLFLTKFFLYGGLLFVAC